MKLIATHKQPDADALAAAWLAQRFLFANCESRVVFVSCSWTPASRAQFACVVDVGRALDLERLLFDHKPPALPDRNSSCAAMLIYKYLSQHGHAVASLEPLMQVVHEGDHRPPRAASPQLKRSRSQGFHATVRRLREAGESDERMLEAAGLWLDGYHFALFNAPATA